MSLTERFYERAAIREFDGGQDRASAEREAICEVLNMDEFRRLTLEQRRARMAQIREALGDDALYARVEETVRAFWRSGKNTGR